MKKAKLIWEEIKKNKNGFPEKQPESLEVYVSEKSVARQEMYEAMRAGVEVKTILVVRSEEWEETRHIVEGKPEYARKVIYDDAIYDIVRSYKTGKATVELTCG